jgi:hypothetical protein
MTLNEKFANHGNTKQQSMENFNKTNQKVDFKRLEPTKVLFCTTK